MSKLFACPYLGRDVELTDEREQHITQTHPGTLPDYLEQLEASLTNPDQIREVNMMKLPYYSPSGLIRFVQGDI